MSSAPQLALISSPIWETRYMSCSFGTLLGCFGFFNCTFKNLFSLPVGTDGSGVCAAAPGKRAAPEVSAATVPPLHSED